MNSERLRHLNSSYPQPGHPPPLPSPHPMFTAFHSSIEMAAGLESNDGEYEHPYDLPILPPDDDDDVAQLPPNSVDTDYHVLERARHQPAVGGEMRGNSGPCSTTSSFSTPPDSPSYHTLEELAGHMTSVSSALTDHLPHEHRLSRLEPIPEHPYHVLENGNESATTKLSDAGPSTLPSISGATDSSIVNREYDRLIGPPHLYHILQHSPSLNKPRIHHYQFSEYDSLAPKQLPETRLDTALTTTTTLTPCTTPDLQPPTDTLSSDSSANGSAVFDDPQYGLSPEPPEHVPPTDDSCTHTVPLAFVQSHNRDTNDATKYSGDYERDPTYMMRLHSSSCSPKLLLSSSQLIKTVPLSGSQDDSGFCCYVTSNETELKRQWSLPNVYQALQMDTMDTHTPYQRVVKQHCQPSKTST